MFTSIKTSKENKEIVTLLTRKLNLGAENIIARLAFSYSVAQEKKMDLLKIGDSQGKEYTSKILFGDHLDIYVAIVCVNYKLYKTDKDLSKYIKMHIDDGLTLINQEVQKNPSITGIEFLINKIDRGISKLN